MSTLRRKTKESALQLFSAVGGPKYLRRQRSASDVLILCYHSIVPDRHNGDFLYRNSVSAEEFTRQIDFVSQSFTFISAGDLTSAVVDGRPLPPRPALITFDDGYRNNVLYAAPILRKYRVPALFSVVTGMIGTEAVLWTDEINLFVMLSQRQEIPVPSRTGVHYCSMPADTDAKVELAQRIRQQCKEMSQADLDHYLQTLRTGSYDCPASIRDELLRFMTWDEVRALSAEGFAIASHTVTHPMLSRISAPQICYELRESKQRIEDELGIACPWIVYPNGQARDYTTEVIDHARDAGYRMGFIATGQYANVANSPFEIDRIGVGGHAPLAVFDLRISGLSRYLS